MTQLVPRGIVVLVTFALFFLTLFGCFSSVMHSGATYATVPEQFLEQNTAIISYLVGPLFIENPLTFLPEAEFSHMSDVKLLFDIAFILAVLSFGILLGIFGTFAWKKMKKQIEELLARSLWVTGWLLLFLCVFFGLASLFNFQKFWALLHVMLFPQGNWMFPVDSLLIQMYSIEFFSTFVVRWLVRLLALGILAVGLGFVLDRFRFEEHLFDSKLLKPGAKTRKHGSRKKK